MYVQVGVAEVPGGVAVELAKVAVGREVTLDKSLAVTNKETAGYPVKPGLQDHK